MNTSKFQALLRSLLVSYLLSGILLLLLSFALYKFRLREEPINMTVYGIYVLSCLAGGWLAGKHLRSRRFFWGLLSGCLYFLVLLLISLAFSARMPFDTSRIAATLACCIGGGMAGGMLS